MMPVNKFLNFFFFVEFYIRQKKRSNKLTYTTLTIFIKRQFSRQPLKRFLYI